MYKYILVIRIDNINYPASESLGRCGFSEAKQFETLELAKEFWFSIPYDIIGSFYISKVLDNDRIENECYSWLKQGNYSETIYL